MSKTARRRWARRAWMGLATVLGVAPRGFFIPHRYAGAVPAPADRAPYGALAPYFDAARPAFAALLRAMADHEDAFRAIGDDAPPAPRWRQGWFAPLDAAACYTLVRTRRPRRIVEVGSGHSTRFIARAAADADCAPHHVAIDPAPRADIAALPVELLRMSLQQAGTDAFAALEAGDMMVIDSSHILMPGTDVDIWLNRIWPTLADGVLVHVHDIFLPDDYPADWAWRGYNEQLALGPLIASGAASLLFASYYVQTRMADAFGASPVAALPRLDGARDSSLWLVKGGAAGPP